MGYQEAKPLVSQNNKIACKRMIHMTHCFIPVFYNIDFLSSLVKSYGRRDIYEKRFLNIYLSCLKIYIEQDNVHMHRNIKYLQCK